LILDYYLEPYLYKVSKLGKPILIVDCFAGPGKFDDGLPGSPLIIIDRLRKIHERAVDVKGMFIESEDSLYEKLEKNTRNTAINIITRHGNFRDYVSEIAKFAKDHTVFIYLDPIRPGDLLFNDLKLVYEHLKSGQSIETLINFLSRGFLRRTWGLKPLVLKNGELPSNDPKTIACNDIAGGSYWQRIAFNDSLPHSSQIEDVVNGYSSQLQRWFKWTLTYPIREKYEYKLPKYHLVFGSRSNHAVDLMNRAMVKARREFVGARFIEGMLFPNQPTKEIPDPVEIKNTILETSKKFGKMQWELLRAQATVANPCMYNDSEFNSAIKHAIKSGDLNSDCTGDKIEEDAFLWISS
jgi:three-Cys-motif partner protein